MYVNSEPASLPPNASGVRLGRNASHDLQDGYIHPLGVHRLTEQVENLNIVVDDVYEEIPHDRGEFIKD